MRVFLLLIYIIVDFMLFLYIIYIALLLYRYIVCCSISRGAIPRTRNSKPAFSHMDLLSRRYHVDSRIW
jgi:hypothetical protein